MRSSEGGRISSENSSVVRMNDWPRYWPVGPTCPPYDVDRSVKLGVTPSQGPQCSGMVTLGAISLRSTKLGVSNPVTVSMRWTAPANESNEKYRGMCLNGA